MNRNLHSPTKLTEFARDFDAEPETFLTKFVNKITNAYNSGYNTVNVSGSSPNSPLHIPRSNSDQCVTPAQPSPTTDSLHPALPSEPAEPMSSEHKSTTPTPTTSDSVSMDESGEKVI